MSDATHQTQYLAEAVRQVEGGLRLRMVEGLLLGHSKTESQSSAKSDLATRVLKTIELWCNPEWMPGVNEVIRYLAVNQQVRVVPKLVEYHDKVSLYEEFESIFAFAGAFLKEQGKSSADPTFLSPSPVKKDIVPAVCWINQAQALVQWKHLSQDLKTLAIRKELCDELSQLNDAIDHYGRSVDEQRKRERRLPVVLRNSRALQILDNISRVATSVQQQLSEIELRNLKGTTSSAYRDGENHLSMQSLFSETDWPASVLFELFKEQDESFLEL